MASLRDYIPGDIPGATLNSFIPGSDVPAALGAPLAGPENLATDDLREAAGMTQIGRGFKSGRLGGDANYLASQEFSLRAAGDLDGANALRQQIEALQQRAGTFAPRVQRVEDAWANPADAPAWLGGVTGQVGASMLDSIGTGLAARTAAKAVGLIPHPIAKAIGAAGSWIGAGAAAVPNVLQARGETANAMVEDSALMERTTPQERNDAAWLSGGAQGAIDTVLPSMIVNRLGGAGLAKGIHKLPVVPRIAADVALEGTQEVVQEGMKKGTLGLLNPERDTSGDASDYLNAFVTGLGTAPFSAGSVAADNAFRRLGVKGDGQRGEDIDLSDKKPGNITEQLSRAAKTPGKMPVAEAHAYWGLLRGAAEDSADESGLVRRRDALLGELAKFPGDAKAVKLAEQLAPLNDPLSLMDGMPVMDEAAAHVAPKLGLTNEQLAKKAEGLKKNSEQVSRFDFGKGQIDSADFAARPAPEQEAIIESAREHKTRVSRVTSLLENSYTKQHAFDGTTVNPSIKKLLGGYGAELAALVSPGVAGAPSLGDIARAKRIGAAIGSALGARTEPVLEAVSTALRAKGKAFDALSAEASKVATHRLFGDRAVFDQHKVERDTAALQLLDAVPEFDARMAKQGVDLRDPENDHLREQFLKHVEDHADGEGSATRAQLEEQFGKEGYEKMMEIVGGPIVPRHESTVYAEQKAARKLSSDDTVVEDASTFDKNAAEKSHAAVPSEAMVFGHSQTTGRKASDAFRPDAKGTLLKLVSADRVDSSGKRSLDTMAKNLQRSIGSASKGFVFGRQGKDDPQPGRLGTSAKTMMDRQNMDPDRRISWFAQYLEQHGDDKGHTEFVETVKALPFLHKANRIMSEAVQAKQLGTTESSKRMRGLLKAVSQFVVNPEQFETDMPTTVPGRAAQNLAIAKAVHKAYADVRAGLTQYDSLAGLISEFKAANDGREPDALDLANHFAKGRFMVHAEKEGTRDHLIMSPDEFTALHKKGSALLRTAKHQAWASKGEGSPESVAAGMNLLHFPGKGNKTITIPAHKLVAWVRTLRNQHEADLNTGDKVKSRSDNADSDLFLADLSQGIAALVNQKLVQGMPYIVNAEGGKEMFSEGSVPPSLGVGDGRLFGKMKETRTEAAEKRLEKKAGREAEAAALNQHRNRRTGSAFDYFGDSAKDAELAADEADMQDADHVREADEMMNGSERGREQEDHVWKQTQVMLAAADKLPESMNKLQLWAKAERIADNLWRDYTDPKANRSEAFGRILAYVKSIEGIKWGDRTELDTRRGDDYVAPLTALVTPARVAAVAANYPKEARRFEMLRARVASVLLDMAQGERISGVNYKTAIDRMSGFADAKHDLEAAERLMATGTDNARAQAAITEAKSRSPVKLVERTRWLSSVAQPYDQLVKERQAKAAAETADKELASAQRRDVGPVRPQISPFMEFVGKIGAKPTEGVALTAAEQAKAKEKGEDPGRVRPVTSIPSTVGADKSTTVSVDATPKPRQITRKTKSVPGRTVGGVKRRQARLALVNPVKGDYAKTQKDAYSDVAADTAAAEKQVDDTAALAGKLATSARESAATARNVTAKKEMPGIFKDAAEKLRGGETIQSVNDALATKMDSAPTAPAAHQAKESAKLSGADLILAPAHMDGGEKSASYAGRLGAWAARAGKIYIPAKNPDMTGKVLYVSLPGKGRGFEGYGPMIKRVMAALEAGATVRTDNEKNAGSAHNVQGEGALRAALIAGGYAEKNEGLFSSWTKAEAPKTEAPKAEAKAPAFPMNYRDGQVVHSTTLRMRPEFTGKDTMDLIISGDRTATTGSLGRFNGAKKGDVVMATGNGKQALIRFTSDPYRVERGNNEAWSKLEGWAPEVMNEYIGQYQATYELVGKPVVPPTATTLAEAIERRQDYVDNPPDDYSAEQVQKNIAWAERQLERVSAAVKAAEVKLDEAIGARADPAGLKTSEAERANEEALGDEVDRLNDLKSDLRLLIKDSKDSVGNDAEAQAIDKRDGTGLFRKNNEQIADARGTKAEEPAVTKERERQLGIAVFQTPKDKDIFQAKMYLKRVLGDKITALFAATFPDMKEGAGADWTHTLQTVRIATANPVSILQRAYHEAMHAFFSNVLANSPEAKALMTEVFSTPAMIERMAALLKDSPNAVAAMRADPEERVAYGYQFWAAGLLKVGKKPTTFFEKVQRFLSKVFGLVRADDKALMIMESFHDGKMVEPSAAGEALLKIMQSDQWRAAFLKKHDKAAQAAHSELMASINVGLNNESPSAQAFAKDFYHHPAVGKGDEATGLIDARMVKHNQYQNGVWSALKLLRGDNEALDMAELHEVLNGQAEPTQPNVAAAAEKIRDLMTHFLAYLKEAGVDIGNRDGKNYFPRVVSVEYLVEHKQEFVDMLTSKYANVLKSMLPGLRHAQKGETIEDAAAYVWQQYIDHGGVEDGKLSVQREDGVLNPFFASQNKRSNHWIRAEDLKPFLSKDLVSTMTRYFAQGVRSAEYVRRFGRDGQRLKDGMAREGDLKFMLPDGTPELYTEDGPVVSELKAEAAKQGLKDTEAEEWVNRRMEDLQRSFGALEGSLGKDISASARQLQGWVMVYQVLRTLPLSLFSAMLDPNGLRVAGGTSADMWEAYKRGLMGVFRNWKDMATGTPLGMREPEAYELEAEAMGVIGSSMALEEMGAVHGSEYEAGAARRINHRFFMWNGITAWDRQMRMVATGAAMRSIVNNEANGVPAHSARWLKDLGLTQGDGVIRTDADGKLIWNRHALAALRAKENGTTVNDEMAQATEDVAKISVAVNRWVTRAIMAPNAALRPSRASDPHYAMFFQLKSFTYAFQETTMRYALEEARKGNLNSGVQLLRGVPIMIAADMTKAVLTNGGSLPGYMMNWTMADWVMHGMQRGGLAGTGQFGLDVLHNPHGLFAGAVSVAGGPTVGQAVDLAAGTLDGELGVEIVKGIPFVNKIGGISGAVRGLTDIAE
jgi:hypothetical protein